MCVCYGQNSAVRYKLYFWPLIITEFKPINLEKHNHTC